jgi:[ribosomal protein S18]-alanine N-acetyltransferase
MPAELFIRSMKADDIEEVLAIDRLSFPTPWPRSAYLHELTKNQAARLWVAEVDEAAGERQIVAMIVLWMILDEAHIATIAVHPNFRRELIGSRLLVFALKQAIQEGARQATLEVRAGNQVAQSLYRNFGFTVVRRRPRYYRDNNEDALLMSLSDMDAQVLDGFLCEALNDGGGEA